MNYVQTIRQKIGHDLLVLVGAAAIILNDKNEVLLQQRSDNHKWGVPGGAVEPGEEPAAAVIREVKEETGLTIRPERIVGIYGGKSHLINYPNGDQAAITSITFLCRIVEGEPHIDDDETLALGWFAGDNLPDHIMPHHIERIHHALTRDSVFFRVLE